MTEDLWSIRTLDKMGSSREARTLVDAKLAENSCVWWTEAWLPTEAGIEADFSMQVPHLQREEKSKQYAQVSHWLYNSVI